MKLLLRGITRADDPPPRVASEALQQVDAGQLRAFASWSEPLASHGRDELLEHHRIVHELHWRTRACLPVRFPTWFDSEAPIRASLEQRTDDFEAALERISGRAELAITVLQHDAEPRDGPAEAGESGGGPGARYLRQRARTLRDGVNAAAALRALTEREAIETRESLSPRQGVLLSLAILVPMDDAEAVAERLRRAAPNSDDVRILLNGPWPPYTFAVVPAREG